MFYGSAADCRSREVATLHDYWRSKLRNGALPRHADIDLAEVPALLPGLIIAEYVGEAGGRPRVLYRLVGATHAHYAAADYTGHYLDEMSWSEREFLVEIHDTLRRTAAPVFGFFHWDFRDHLPGLSEFGFFPLSADGSNVTHTIGYEDCSEFEEQLDRAR
jgi:hypothetical protein